MVDPRIYRALMVVVAFAVIVFGFSLQRRPAPLSARLAPGQFFASLQSNESTMAARYPQRSPGSAGDAGLAAYLARALAGADGSGISGFSVQTQRFTAPTPAGPRTLENVIATKPGLGSGTIVVVSDRDAPTAPGRTELYSTAVMLGLAQALSAETLSRSVTLVSTSGQVGVAGATHLAQTLSGQPVDAVIALGNLAGEVVHGPVVVPWSNTDRMAPPLLVGTLAHAISSQAGIANVATGLAGQVARMAFPFAVTEQAPFAASGLPAVLVSLSGDRPVVGSVALGPAGRPAALGTALLNAVNALDRGRAVGSPGSYLSLSGQLVPLWAVRLLVLALILPVAAVTLDAAARVRRRGHMLTRWLAWVLAGVAPFVIGLLALLLARASGVLSFAPAGAVAATALSGGNLTGLLVALVAVAVSFFILRPVFLRWLARRLPESRRRPESPAADAAAVALSAVLCVLSVVVWSANPFAALLLIPALHLWVWLAQPEVRSRRWAVALLLALGSLPALLILFYYANAYGLSPFALIASLVLLPGGAMSLGAALYWSVAAGCLASAGILSVRALRAGAAVAAVPVSVRGPATYAGPGSLGGTGSALRR
jgi:hypothetical protein